MMATDKRSEVAMTGASPETKRKYRKAKPPKKILTIRIRQAHHWNVR